jgi:hypothetical protein
MKLFRTALIVSFFSLSLMAAGAHGGGGAHAGGFSGGGYRGGYGGIGYGGYARGYGYGGYYGGYRGFYGFGFGFGYPYYWGGYYYPYYAPYYYDPYYYAPAYVAAPAYVEPAPAYVSTPAPAPAAQTGSYYHPADFYLIAFNDHNIKAAQSYTIVGDQIEWTPREGGAAMRAPLASVDKRFTAQINRDRRVKLELP